MADFLPEYDAQYAPLLGVRTATFRQIFAYLQSTFRGPYRIIETGTSRAEGNWAGDGQSTLLWDKFVSLHGGNVYSIDIEPSHMSVVRPQVSPRTQLICSDSAIALANMKGLQDTHLVYLDSYDLDAHNPHPSMLHHIFELAAIYRQLQPGTLVVVDDCLSSAVGKHVYVKQFFDMLHNPPLFTGYQTGWVVQ